MNIFKDAVGFIQGIGLDELLAAEAAFFETALEVRHRLGTKAYLADNYLSQALKIANARMPMDITEAGREAFSEIIHAVAAVRDGAECSVTHQERIKESLAHFQSLHQENYTATKLATIKVIQDMLPVSLKKYTDGYLFELLSTYDELRLDHLFDEISRSVGEELMERLNEMIQKRFIVAAPLSMFLQGFTNYYLDTLNAEDIETNKQLFQLILDDLSSNQTEEKQEKVKCTAGCIANTKPLTPNTMPNP